MTHRDVLQSSTVSLTAHCGLESVDPVDQIPDDVALIIDGEDTLDPAAAVSTDVGIGRWNGRHADSKLTEEGADAFEEVLGVEGLHHALVHAVVLAPEGLRLQVVGGEKDDRHLARRL